MEAAVQKLTGDQLRERALAFLRTLEGYSVPDKATKALWKDMCLVGALMQERDIYLDALRHIRHHDETLNKLEKSPNGDDYNEAMLIALGALEDGH